MKLIDTHTHLFLNEFDSDRDEVIKNAISSGVDKMILPNVDSSTLHALLSLQTSYCGHCFSALGLHPGSVHNHYNEELKHIYNAIENNDPVAIGEIGIDLYRDKTFKEQQILAFKIQIEWALERNLPILIHNRESFGEIIEILNEYKKNTWKGIFHCFTGTKEQADRVIKMGFALGIGGVVTFKNAGLDKVVRQINLKHIVLETDSPYLAPVPERGKRNESAYLIHIAEKVAEIKHCSIYQVAEKTTSNAEEIFTL